MVTRIVHHLWTNQEDGVLVRCLHVMANDPKWKGENDTFRSGYLSQLKKMLGKELLELKLKADSHIKSRVRLLKRQYNAIYEMITTRSGFGWNDQEKCVTSSKDVFDGWVRVSLKSK